MCNTVVVSYSVYSYLLTLANKNTVNFKFMLAEVH